MLYSTFPTLYKMLRSSTLCLIVIIAWILPKASTEPFSSNRTDSGGTRASDLYGNTSTCHVHSPGHPSNGGIFTYNLVFEWAEISPDNFRQKGILTNGQFPGPPIIVQQYSTLIVNVVNKLDEGFTLHFHGIHQHGTLTSDGVPSVTQYEIPPCGTYRYVIFIGPQFGDRKSTRLNSS